MTKNHLVWFRNDLRIHDNAPLTAALLNAKKNNERVYAAFIYSPNQLASHGVGTNKRVAYARALHPLNKSLAALGIPLTIIQSESWSSGVNDLITLCHEKNIGTVYCHYEPGWDEKYRDTAFRETAQPDITLNRFNDLYLIHPKNLLTQQGSYYKVFTAYKKALFAQLNTHLSVPLGQPVSHLTEIIAPPLPIEPGGDWSNPLQLPINETDCRNRLEDYSSNVSRYADVRDFPAQHATSGLSVGLSLGSLSSRQIAWHMMSLQKLTPDNTWFSEIVWREFYKYLTYWKPELCLGRAFNPTWDAFPWVSDKKALRAWKHGNTGVPIVDAAMRQLLTTGWMHNRLRMVSAMYLVKILQINWREGEQWFAQHLADFDFSANNGGWQWVASTGVDAAPYFRIFNPYEQSRRFDPKGAFIRNYVPELASVDTKYIHEPNAVLCAEHHYPVPIVHYPTARKDTLEKFKNLRNPHEQYHRKNSAYLR